jgi:broad specificity phosphatase PhoE
MARLAVTRILSSPQQRALATARPIAQVHRVPVTVRPELAELDFGEWEGRSWRSLAPRQRRLHRAWLSDPWHVTPPGGESLRSLWRRVGRVWRDLQASLDGGATVVVAHGGSLRVLLCRALRLPPRALGRFWLRPGAVSCLAWDAGCAWIEALNHDPSGL